MGLVCRLSLRFRVMLCLAATVLVTTPVSAEVSAEAKVKAAYLFHLAQFVDWPSLPDGEIRFCVIGSDAVGDMMSGLANRQVHDRPLKIEVGDRVVPDRCQVLYIDKDAGKGREILQKVRGRSVLTVSDMRGFVRKGGVVGFYEDAGNIRLEINTDSARASNLKLSAKLLEVARTVP